MHRPHVLHAPLAIRFGSRLAAFCLAALATACGDDAKCPAGTAGDPCRYTIGVGDAPSVPTSRSGGDSDAAVFDDDTPDGADAAPEADVDDEGLDDSSRADHPTPNPDAAAGAAPARTASSAAPRSSATDRAPAAFEPDVPERHVARTSEALAPVTRSTALRPA